MLIKIFAVATLTAICTGDVMINNHEPHSSLKHAVSSQSYIRHDVPLSYKHSAVHIYSTEKPHNILQDPVTPGYQLSRVNYQPQVIQYAPVIREESKEQTTKVEENTTPAQKSNLEPKPQSKPDQLQFVPGYNIEIMQSVNRYPGHNAVYRSYPHMKPYEKLNRQHHLKQLILHNMNQEILLPELIDTTQSAPTFDFIPKQYKAENPTPFIPGPLITDYNSLITPEMAALNIQMQGYPPHPKDHRMLLNIAHPYNIAKQPAKAHNDISRTIKQLPSRSQALHNKKHAKSKDNELKTRLFPVMYKSLPQFS